MKRIRTGIGISLLVVAAAATGGCAQVAEDAPSAAGTASSGAQANSRERFDTLVIPGGTGVLVSLDTPLSTGLNFTGAPFTATTIESIDVGGRTVMPSGSRIHGVLQNVENSGRIAGRARMTLLYESIVDPQGQRYGIAAEPLTLQAASSTHGDIDKIAAEDVLRAIVGAIATGGKGAANGASAGTIVMLATKGSDLELSPGQRLPILMTGATSVQVAAH